MSRLGGSLDTNILIRLIIGDIPEQYDKAQALIQSGETYDIADTALIETIYVLHEYYKVPRKLVAEAITQLLSDKNLRASNLIFDHTLALFVVRPALSIEDCYLAVVAQERKAQPLWTFDKKLARQTDGLARELA